MAWITGWTLQEDHHIDHLILTVLRMYSESWIDEENGKRIKVANGI